LGELQSKEGSKPLELELFIRVLLGDLLNLTDRTFASSHKTKTPCILSQFSIRPNIMSLYFLRIALAINGLLMFAWSPVLFFSHSSLWVLGEGRTVASKKTKFDAMIWRITGLWVAFVGLSCLFVTDVPSGFWSSRWGFSPEALQVVWSPLAVLLAATHAVETLVKYEAMGAKKVMKGASINVLLGALCVAALCIP
jgi:hypothetical protein